MARIERASLLSLEAYARERSAFRARVLEHKKHRSVRLGEHLTLIFEDELTVRYQVQEMLRIERTFEEAGIQGELDAYNPVHFLRFELDVEMRKALRYGVRLALGVDHPQYQAAVEAAPAARAALAADLA